MHTAGLLDAKVVTDAQIQRHRVVGVVREACSHPLIRNPCQLRQSNVLLLLLRTLDGVEDVTNVMMGVQGNAVIGIF